MSADERMDALLRQAGESWRADQAEPAQIDLAALTGPEAEPHEVELASAAAGRHRRRVAVWLSVAAVAAAVMGAAAVIGLGSGSARQTATASGLAGTSWQIVGVRKADGTTVTGLRPATLRFDRTGFGATDSCNYLGGTVAIRTSELTFGDVGSTLMACIPTSPSGGNEQAVIGAVLSGTARWAVVGDALTLSKAGAGTLTYRAVHKTTEPQALNGGWVLTTIEQQGAASTPVYAAALTIDGSTFTVDYRCSQTQGSVRVENGAATFSGATSTPHSCPPPARHSYCAEAAAVDSDLHGNVRWVVTDGQLTITNPRGGALVFAPVPAVSASSSPTASTGPR